jgi:hypothetical protein
MTGPKPVVSDEAMAPNDKRMAGNHERMALNDEPILINPHFGIFRKPARAIQL